MTTALVPSRIPSFFLYGEPPRKSDGRMLHVETIEFRSSRNHWKIRPHVHRTLHQLVFVMRGPGVALTEGAMVAYSPPAVVVVPAGTVHGFDFEPGTHGFVVSMTDDLRAIAQREPGVGALLEQPVTLELRNDALRATELAQSFKMLTREFNRTQPGHALALEGLLTVILANVLRVSPPPAESADAVAVGRYREVVARFRELIEGAFRDGWSLTEYASALSVSESRLRNACLRVTEQSPMQLVNARILLEAKRQLRYTSMSVSEIAYALGFDDPAYFTRFFSQRTGIAPRTFRLG